MLRTPSLLGTPLKYSAFLIPVLAAASMLPASASHLFVTRLPVPNESFLNYQAPTVNALSQEVSVDPQVRSRLAKHFHISDAKMTTYIHNNLVLRHLQKAGTYRVACVRRDGSEYYIESHLPAGTPVFASRATGQPILKLACGNPMVSALPVTSFPNKPLAAPKLASAPVTLANADINVPPVLTAIDGTESNIVTPDDSSSPPVVLVSPSIQALGGGGGLGSLFPALLGAGAAVAVFGNGGSGSNTATPLVPVVPIIPTVPSVPEASTNVSLGLLLAAGGLLLVRRRKSAQ